MPKVSLSIQNMRLGRKNRRRYSRYADALNRKTHSDSLMLLSANICKIKIQNTMYLKELDLLILMISVSYSDPDVLSKTFGQLIELIVFCMKNCMIIY